MSQEILPVQPNGERKLPIEVDSHVDFAERLPSTDEDPCTRRNETDRTTLR